MTSKLLNSTGIRAMSNGWLWKFKVQPLSMVLTPISFPSPKSIVYLTSKAVGTMSLRRLKESPRSWPYDEATNVTTQFLGDGSGDDVGVSTVWGGCSSLSSESDIFFPSKLKDPNITIEEYIMLEEEKARRCGKVYNWETATFGRIWYDDDVRDLRSVETEFPA
uniref:Uncharacterized protein n=1 Tax=Tanacetum cinerariifolium TaxID=118510 RepID=A0A6L2KBN8_TANCI|nr:hypothetical protein [Tanacetum cinerariifolium]